MAAKKLGEAFELASYDPVDVLAVQAVVAGDATSEQQQRAMRWVIEQASNMYGFHFHQAERDTSFALGRAFVGQQIVGLSKLNPMSLRRGAK